MFGYFQCRTCKALLFTVSDIRTVKVEGHNLSMNKITIHLHGDSFDHFHSACATKDSYELTEVVSHC